MTETGVIAEALEVLGGVATRDSPVRATSRVEVDRALSSGEIVVLARGRYASADVAADLATAHRTTAVLSHRSAALHWGWAVRTRPDRPAVTVSNAASPSRSPLSPPCTGPRHRPTTSSTG